MGSLNTNKAWVHDPNLWTYPIICVSTHIERQEADVNTQEFVIPFLTASRPLWENNTVREVTAQESQRLRRWKLWHILIKTFTLQIGTWKYQINLHASLGLRLILSLISHFFPLRCKGAFEVSLERAKLFHFVAQSDGAYVWIVSQSK